MGFKRGQRTQKSNTVLVKVQNCKDRKSAAFYHGKRVAYIYKKNNPKTNLRYKAIWGKVTASHGQSGVVRATFRRNLPSFAMGSSLRVMLYPNKQI
jgi:large subunit ribosomal protein L35Ae